MTQKHYPRRYNQSQEGQIVYIFEITRNRSSWKGKIWLHLQPYFAVRPAWIFIALTLSD